MADVFDQVAAKEDIFDHVAKLLPPADYAASQGAPPLQAKYPTPETNTVGTIYEGAKGLGSALLNFNPISMSKGMLGAGLLPPTQFKERPQYSLADYTRGISPSNAVTNTANEFKQTFMQGDTPAEQYGNLAGNLIAMRRIAQAGRGPSGQPETPVSAEQAPYNQKIVSDLRKVANPDPSDLAFDKQFKEHLPEVLNRYQTENGALPKTAQQFADAFLNSAKSNYDLYYGKVLNHVGNELVSPPAGYKGQKPVDTNLVSLSDLDARLSDINATLNPKFQKGGAGTQAAQAAVSAGEARQLRNEASAIRGVLFDELSKRTGLPADQIADIKSSLGAQRNIGETIQISQNERLAKLANKEMTPQQLTVNPVSLNKQFVLDPVLNKILNRTSPADKTVQNAMDQVRAGGFSEPTVGNIPQAVRDRMPAWMQEQTNGIPQSKKVPQNGTVPPSAEDTAMGLRFRIGDLTDKMNGATPQETAEIQAEIERLKQTLDIIKPRATRNGFKR